MKPFFSILLFFILIGNCFSQHLLTTGVTLGYNSSTFLGKDRPGEGLKRIPGFSLGGIVVYRQNQRFSGWTHVAISSRGVMINTFSDKYEYVAFLYLDIPVAVRLKVLPEKSVSPYVELGGAVDVNIMNLGANGSLYDIKKFDAGIVSGAGVEWKKLSLGIRYFQGLTQFDKSNLHLDLRNSTFSFLAGIKF